MYYWPRQTFACVLMINVGTSGMHLEGPNQELKPKISFMDASGCLISRILLTKKLDREEYAHPFYMRFCNFDYVIRRLENCTRMTSWRRENPRISIQHMVEIRTFWKPICIIDCHMLPRIISWKYHLEFQETLQGSLEIGSYPSYCRCFGNTRSSDSWFIGELIAYFQPSWNLAFGLRYTGIWGDFHIHFVTERCEEQCAWGRLCRWKIFSQDAWRPGMVLPGW